MNREDSPVRSAAWCRYHRKALRPSDLRRDWHPCPACRHMEPNLEHPFWRARHPECVHADEIAWTIGERLAAPCVADQLNNQPFVCGGEESATVLHLAVPCAALRELGLVPGVLR
jgi:hypothetical protein